MRWHCPVHEVEWTTEGEDPGTCWVREDKDRGCTAEPKNVLEVPVWLWGYRDRYRSG